MLVSSTTATLRTGAAASGASRSRHGLALSQMAVMGSERWMAQLIRVDARLELRLLLLLWVWRVRLRLLWLMVPGRRIAVYKRGRLLGPGTHAVHHIVLPRGLRPIPCATAECWKILGVRVLRRLSASVHVI